MGGASKHETVWGLWGSPAASAWGCLIARIPACDMPLGRCAAVPLGQRGSTAKHASEHCEETNFLLTEAASCRIDLLCRVRGGRRCQLLRQADAPNLRSRIVF